MLMIVDFKVVCIYVVGIIHFLLVNTDDMGHVLGLGEMPLWSECKAVIIGHLSLSDVPR
jgi:hypothetical protein